MHNTSNKFISWFSAHKLSVHQFFAHPQLDSPYNSRIAKILDLFILSSIAIVLVPSILLITISLLVDISNYFNVNPFQRLINGVVITLLLLCLRIILKKGHLKSTVRILSVVFIILPTLILYFTGQISSVAILFYAVSLVLSASVLTWRETTLFGILSCICLFVISLLGNLSLLPLSSEYTLSSQLFTSVITFTILLCFLRFEIINRQNVKDTLKQLNLQVTEFDKVNTQLNYSAYHDALTNLPNRRLILQHIEDLLQQKTHNPERNFALLFFDLDHFKFINDTLGHVIGDQVLIEFAQKLHQTIRDTDFSGRLAGDEFVVLLNSIDDCQEAILIAQRVIDDLKTPILIKGKPIQLSSSIGIVFSNHDYTTASELLHAADIALYQAKENQRGTFAIFDELVSQQVNIKLELQNDLPKAIVNNEIAPFFHPIFRLDTLKLAGFELLTRWQHPTKGTINPEVFIPIAEGSNNIAELDGQMLEQACQQFLQWQEHGLLAEDIYLSANLSPKCLENIDFPEAIAKLLAKVNFKPHNLFFEITEGSLIKNIDQVVESLKALKANGIKISIDDFGTGYSSLSSLHSLPLDTIKVDRSFIAQLYENTKNTHIVETIVTLAKSLNMQIVAEGIEEIQQLGHLRSLGCTFGQGYYFAKPLSIQDTTIYLQTLQMQSINDIFTSNDVMDRTKN